jgi:hypothetical protein
LNASPDDEGDEGPNLNQPSAKEQDRNIHDPLEGAAAGEIKRGDPLPALHLQPAV